MLKKVWIFTLLFSLQYCASSVSEKTSMVASEIEPLDQLLIEKAVLPEQKKAVKDYLMQIAKDHRDLSKQYESLSNKRNKGKFKYSKVRQKEMSDLSAKFKQNAIAYEAAASKL